MKTTIKIVKLSQLYGKKKIYGIHLNSIHEYANRATANEVDDDSTVPYPKNSLKLTKSKSPSKNVKKNIRLLKYAPRYGLVGQFAGELFTMASPVKTLSANSNLRLEKCKIK